MTALNLDQLRCRVDACLARNRVLVSDHFRDRCTERNVDINDVEQGLRNSEWKLARPPELDSKRQRYKYRIATWDLDGQALDIVLSFDADDVLELITVI